MAPATATVSTRTLAQQAHATRERAMGIVFLVLAIAMYWLFTREFTSQILEEQGVSAWLTGEQINPAFESTFGLNQGAVPREERLPDLVVPSYTTVLVLSVLAGLLGIYQLARGFAPYTTAALGVIVLFFVMAFIVWAVRDASINLTGMLKTSLAAAIPLTLGALSGLLCERAGVVNVAIEGMLLAGAMMAALIGSVTQNLWLGLAGGMLTGMALAAVHAVLSIRYKVDQIISGTVINIFSVGMTSFISAKFMQAIPELNNPGQFSNFDIPLLSDIPVIGKIFFEGNIFTYGAYILLIVIHVGLFYTRWGLRTRAVGEHPKAADTLGVNVYRTRYIAVLLGGLVAGFGGAYFTIGSVGRFEEVMTAGRGFIGLAAMVFGNYMPFGTFGASLIFGFADSLAGKLAIVDVPFPSQFLLMAPYVATMVALAGLVGRATPPAAGGVPYEK